MALRHGEFNSWGYGFWEDVRVYDGEFYVFDSPTQRSTELECTKLKPVLTDGTERD